MDPLYDLMPVLKDQGFGLMVDDKQKRIFANSESVFITFTGRNATFEHAGLELTRKTRVQNKKHLEKLIKSFIKASHDLINAGFGQDFRKLSKDNNLKTF